jgi:hypothetical protein
MGADDEEAADDEFAAGEEDEEGAEEEFGADDEEGIMEGDDEDTLEESITLKKVSVTHGDNGQNTKSIALKEPKIKTAGVSAVKFSGASEAVPTAPKKPSNPYTKGETEVKGANSWKNAPAKDNFSEKGEAAPKPKHGDDGSNAKSPVAESRKTAKRRI